MPLDSEMWKTQLKRQIAYYQEIQLRPKTLKFNRNYIIPSDIGSQFYCEQKLEEEYLTGKIETEEMNQGTEGHEKIVEDFEKVSLEEAWRKLYSEEQYLLAEFMFIANYKGNFLIGRPDIVYFINSMPIIIFEFKFSRYNEDFLSRHAQARAYGLILKELGFEIRNLFYSIIIFQPSMLDQHQILKSIPNKVIEDFRNGNFSDSIDQSMQYGEVKAYIHKFNIEDAEKNMDWAIEYWKGKRDACCTTESNKCLYCEYRDSQRCEEIRKNI